MTREKLLRLLADLVNGALASLAALALVHPAWLWIPVVLSGGKAALKFLPSAGALPVGRFIGDLLLVAGAGVAALGLAHPGWAGLAAAVAGFKIFDKLVLGALDTPQEPPQDKGSALGAA